MSLSLGHTHEHLSAAVTEILGSYAGRRFIMIFIEYSEWLWFSYLLRMLKYDIEHFSEILSIVGKCWQQRDCYCVTG